MFAEEEPTDEDIYRFYHAHTDFRTCPSTDDELDPTTKRRRRMKLLMRILQHHESIVRSSG